MARLKEAAPLTTAQRLDSIVKSARKIMRKDKGLNGDLDRLPMLTWILFLKFLDDMECVHEDEAILAGQPFRPAIEPPYRWRDWAARADGITGPDLIAFIGAEEATRPDSTRGPGLFAYLRNLRGRNGGRDRRDVIATVFRGLSNRMESGYLLREVANLVQGIHFDSSDEIHTLSRLYEGLLREMRDAAGARQAKTVEAHEWLQRDGLRGIEAKSLPFLLAQMNLVLHGMEAPDIDPGNALRHRLSEVGERDRVEVILTNPPFGGEEEAGILGSFPEDRRTSETALLFLQLIMRRLKRGGRGRAGVVVPNGTLFGDGVAARIKADLLERFNLHTVIRLPEGVFAPYTDIPANLLFFDTSGPTDEIWYWEQPAPEGRRKYSKTQPLQYEELSDCLAWWRERREGPRAWKVRAADLIRRDGNGAVVAVNLDVKNPSAREIIDQRTPEEIIESVIGMEREVLATLDEIKALLSEGASA